MVNGRSDVGEHLKGQDAVFPLEQQLFVAKRGRSDAGAQQALRVFSSEENYAGACCGQVVVFGCLPQRKTSPCVTE